VDDSCPHSYFLSLGWDELIESVFLVNVDIGIGIGIVVAVAVDDDDHPSSLGGGREGYGKRPRDGTGGRSRNIIRAKSGASHA
jgi:hypothetical protein